MNDNNFLRGLGKTDSVHSQYRSARSSPEPVALELDSLSEYGCPDLRTPLRLDVLMCNPRVNIEHRHASHAAGRPKSSKHGSEASLSRSLTVHEEVAGRTARWQANIARRHPGWKLGAFMGYTSACLVLVINLLLLVFGATWRGGYAEGLGSIARGTSDSTARLSTAYHILINILSTVLLSSSNFCMQVLSAPTRNDVDKAHTRGDSLEIGIMSIRNLTSISVLRQILWWILFSSSLPLHLFYNSVISGAAAGRQYNVYVVDFFNTTSVWDLAGLEELKSSAWRNFQGTQVPVTCSTLEHPAYECLTNKQWQSLYDNKYVPDHGDLVLLVDTLAFNANWTIFSGADGNLTASLDGFNERSLGLQNRVVVNTSDYDPSYMPSFDFVVYSGVLHWLLSQTLVLRRLEVREREGNIISDKSLCTVGYSPVSLLVFVVMAFIGAVLIVRLSFWLKPSKRMPWGANSSLVLSAACHPPPTDADAQLNGLQWGVVKSRFPGTTVGHCCFTSEDVTPPEADNRYA